MKTCLILLLTLTALNGCRSSTSEPDTATVLFDLRFPPDSSDAEPDITGIRIETVDASTGVVLVTHDVRIIEGVTRRMVALSIKQNLNKPLIFEVDLLTGENADAVTWTGVTEPITLRAGNEERPVVTFTSTAEAQGAAH